MSGLHSLLLWTDNELVYSSRSVCHSVVIPFSSHSILSQTGNCKSQRGAPPRTEQSSDLWIALRSLAAVIKGCLCRWQKRFHWNESFVYHVRVEWSWLPRDQVHVYLHWHWHCHTSTVVNHSHKINSHWESMSSLSIKPRIHTNLQHLWCSYHRFVFLHWISFFCEELNFRSMGLGTC